MATILRPRGFGRNPPAQLTDIHNGAFPDCELEFRIGGPALAEHIDYGFIGTQINLFVRGLP